MPEPDPRDGLVLGRDREDFWRGGIAEIGQIGRDGGGHPIKDSNQVGIASAPQGRDDIGLCCEKGAKAARIRQIEAAERRIERVLGAAGAGPEAIPQVQGRRPAGNGWLRSV